MAKFITKHRRGTISQWTGKIPEEGEIALEQVRSTVLATNGEGEPITKQVVTYKMKVGNGTSAYEDLPYVTAEVAAKILSTRNELSADIQGVRRETAERVDQLVAAWEGSELTDVEKLGSEIVDARTRYEGYAAVDDAGVAESGQSFDSVGDALRSIDRELQELRYISAGGFDTGRAAGAVRDYIDEQVSGVADQVSSLIGAKIPAGLTYEDNQLWLNDSNGE